MAMVVAAVKPIFIDSCFTYLYFWGMIGGRLRKSERLRLAAWHPFDIFSIYSSTNLHLFEFVLARGGTNGIFTPFPRKSIIHH